MSWPHRWTAGWDGVEVHAQVIENLLGGERLVRPEAARVAELLFAFVVGCLALLVLPRLGVVMGSWLCAFVIVIAIACGFGLFAINRWLLDPTPAITTVFVMGFVLMASLLMESNRQRRALNVALQEERVETARMTGELNAAREIQLGMLPGLDRAERLPEAIRLHALIEPAREVGGDLYDFYMLDERRLFLMVGDVSGKGVPASLFMAISKTLLKQVAAHQTTSVGAVTTELNNTLIDENPAELFVTTAAVVIDITTGSGELCLAGHDAPFILSPGRGVRTIDSAGGPPLCVLEDFDYPTETFHLAPGETLLLWTDGVGEASRRQDPDAPEQQGVISQYAREGVSRYLAALPANSNPSEVVEGLFRDVQRFATDTDNTDDITIIAVQYSP